jgi:hypothetical protein
MAVNDLVMEYMKLERELLLHRLASELAGLPDLEDDPEEARIEDAFERLWQRMSAEERRRLRQVRELRSAPWLDDAFGASVLVDAPSPKQVGAPARRRVGTP